MDQRGWVIAGLGNPGSKYNNTRHNAGFMVLEQIRDQFARSSAWRAQFKGETAQGEIDNQKVLLIKPQTYMNLSGESVQPCLAFHKILPSQLIVVHDEIDIPFGQIRIKKGGGSGGHNGIKSISEVLATQEYYRVRIGVGRPLSNNTSGQEQGPDVSSYVLSPFNKEELQQLEQFLKRGVQAVETLISRGLAEAQRLFH